MNSSNAFTVNGQPASIYHDLTFAVTNGITLSNGINQFTVIATSNSVSMTNSLTQYLPASQNLRSDANGNLIWDGLHAFQYDDANELTQVTVTNLYKTQFIYDGFGRRRIRRDFNYNLTTSTYVETNEVHYLYDGMNVVQEQNSNSVPEVSYTRGVDLSGTRQRAGGIGGLLARTDGTGTSFYHADGNGNITMLVDASGNVKARYLYDPFGNTLGMWGPLASVNTYRFSSKEIDLNSGMYYYGFRYYVPNLQRWLNRDPIQELGGINLYVYVKNNPGNLIDLDGFDPLGHHLVPKAIWENMSKRVQNIWNDARNRLDEEGYKSHNGKSYGPEGGEKVTCKEYNEAVEDELEDFLDEHGADDPEDLTDGELQEFADQIRNTTDGKIGTYNAGVAEEIAAETDLAAEGTTIADAVYGLNAAIEIDEAAVFVGAVVK